MVGIERVFRSGLLALCVCCASAGAHAQLFKNWISNIDQSPKVGVQVKIERFTPDMARRIKAFGFSFVRFGVWMNSMQLASYRNSVSAAFDAADSAGLPVLLTVRSTVSLVQPAQNDESRTAQLRESATQLVDLISRLTGTYQKNLLAIELWNEPDLPAYWPTGSVDWTFPVFIQAVCEKLKSVHTLTPVIGFGFSSAPMMSTRSGRLLQSIQASSSGCIDAVSYHAYGMSSRQIQDVSADVRSRYGLPVVISEWGVSSGGKKDAVGQADEIKSFLAKRAQTGTPLMSIYEWQDSQQAKNSRERNFGLVDATGAAKPAFGSARAALSVK